ncbi:MAG: L,D-transpeptidase family protein, partial [Chthoniobacterales bacterium]
QIVVSVAEQKLAVIRDGEVIRKYTISTSKFGVGDSFGSYRTPLGSLKISEKIGGGLPAGAVIKHRAPTGEVLRPNAPGRDPIVSRILWLDGQETANQNAHGRGVYIHGTPDEKHLGRPASYGCIRMKSSDVIELYSAIPVGTSVSITKGRLPGSNVLVAMFASAEVSRRGNARL